MKEEIIIGGTGTQIGMSNNQKLGFRNGILHLTNKYIITEFHHGDCVGADSDMHDEIHIIRQTLNLPIQIIGHPPINSSKRAFKKCDIWREPKEYLERNHDIVDDIQVLFAAPKEPKEIIRSGTWATIRYCSSEIAAGKNKEIVRLWRIGIKYK